MKMNMVSWFEIPVENMDRAVKFYQSVFDVELHLMNMGGEDMGWFPSEEGAPGAAGSLIKSKTVKPSSDGVCIYFASRANDVDVELGKVERAGGTVVVPKTKISDEIGFFGQFMDSEGNRISLFSSPQ